MDGYLGLFIIVYLICHIPAFVMLIIGFSIQSSKPDSAKILFILTGIYFLVGAGICGSMFV